MAFGRCRDRYATFGLRRCIAGVVGEFDDESSQCVWAVPQVEDGLDQFKLSESQTPAFVSDKINTGVQWRDGQVPQDVDGDAPFLVDDGVAVATARRLDTAGQSGR